MLVFVVKHQQKIFFFSCIVLPSFRLWYCSFLHNWLQFLSSLVGASVGGLYNCFSQTRFGKLSYVTVVSILLSLYHNTIMMTCWLGSPSGIILTRVPYVIAIQLLCAEFRCIQTLNFCICPHSPISP